MTFKLAALVSALLCLGGLAVGAWLMVWPGHRAGEIAFGGILVVLNFYNLAMIGRSLAYEDWNFTGRKGKR